MKLLRHQLDLLWQERERPNWSLVGDTSATARSFDMVELADALLHAYNEKSKDLLEQVLLPRPADFLAGVEKGWVAKSGMGMPEEERFPGRLIHVEPGFRFEWFAYLDNSKRPRHQILISYEPEAHWPTVDDVARGFDVSRRRAPGFDALMLDDKIGDIRDNTLTGRVMIEFYPHTIHLWYDVNVWQRLHDMIVRVWRNVERQPHYHVLVGMPGYMPNTFLDREGAIEWANELAHQFGDEPETEVEGDPETGNWDIGNETIEVTECDQQECLQDVDDE